MLVTFSPTSTSFYCHIDRLSLPQSVIGAGRKMLDVDSLLKNYFQNTDEDKSKFFMKAASSVLKKLLHQDEINYFIETNQYLEGLELNDAILDHFHLSFQVSNKDRARIPDHRRVLIVANHPLGSLDGLALLKLVSEIRTDVKIVATPLLNCIDPLQSLFLSGEETNGIHPIVAALEAEQAVILFPTGDVSRISPLGVRDGKWNTDFLSLAKRTQAPIVPVFIDGKNSTFFYGLSGIYKPLGTLMLVNEMFNKKDSEIVFRIGKPIPWESIAAMDLSKRTIAKLMRKQVYLLGKKKKKELFKPIENIIHPVRTKLIRKELKASQLIGKTHDGKHIYLFDYLPNSSVMREIGRLRELSFRQVQEGTGHALDIDRYDRYYRHLILWDEEELEIIGAYRIGEAANILKKYGESGLYTHSLFEFTPTLAGKLEHAIELGRSFIQPRYQNKQALDYLWYGIGAYLYQHPEVRYMLGPVSLSTALPELVQKNIASFYSQLFGSSEVLAIARRPFGWNDAENKISISPVTNESEYKQAYAMLKEKLGQVGAKVPILYKQYVELCQPGGCQFLGFNVDPSFSNCVDGLILVHIEAIKEKKYQRYIESHAAVSKRVVSAGK